MARPKKSPGDLRQHVVTFRMSPVELALLDERTDKSGMSRGNFLRKSALQNSITVRKSQGADFATRDALRRIGVNINQLARIANSGDRIEADRLNDALDQLDALFDKWL